MFCGQCGKKVNDNMLFCPFCGTAIIVPDQDEEEAGTAAAAETELVSDADRKPATPELNRARSEVKRPAIRSLFDEIDDPDDFEDEQAPFVPLISKQNEAQKVDLDQKEAGTGASLSGIFSEDNGMPENDRDFEDEYDEYDEGDDDSYDDDDIDEDEPPVQVKRPVISRFAAKPVQVRRSNNTYIPVRDTNPEDMFLGTDEEDDYDRDDYDSDGYDDYDDDYDFDEPEKRKPFLIRHIRGVIGIVLLLAVLAGCAVFVMLPTGQQTLARLNLAWQADAYAAVGRADYDKGSYAEAASYYVRAMEKDKTNYEYVHSALVCYYYAGNTEEAKNMALKCIELRPDSAEPYRELLNIYGNGELPSLVKDYIQEGYRRTGDEYLNLNNYNM